MDGEYSEEDECLFNDYVKEHLKEYGQNYLYADPAKREAWKKYLIEKLKEARP